MLADEGGIFKATTSAKETEGAEEVIENKETLTELPIDQQEAAEIKVSILFTCHINYVNEIVYSMVM